MSYSSPALRAEYSDTEILIGPTTIFHRKPRRLRNIIRTLIMYITCN